MASLEKKSVSKEHLIFKGLSTWRDPCALTKSRNYSVSASILRRQLDPTNRTKYTVQNQASFLRREILPRVPDNGRTSTPFWMPSITAYEMRNNWPVSTDEHIYDTFVESEPISASFGRPTPGISKRTSTTIMDLQGAVRAEEHYKKLKSLDRQKELLYRSWLPRDRDWETTPR